MSAWNRITNAYNSLNRVFPIWGREKHREDRVDRSSKEITNAYTEIWSIGQGVAKCKARMIEAEKKEPFKNDPEFIEDRSVRDTFKIPRLFCKDILDGLWTRSMYLEYSGTEGEQAQSDHIAMVFGAAVGVLEDVYNAHAQELLEGTLKSDLFFQTYQAGQNRGGFQNVMSRLIKMTQLPKAGHCPEAIVKQLCNSMVIGSMLRDAEPLMAAKLLGNMFHGYDLQEAVARMKDVPIIGLLLPSFELANALELKRMPYEFIEAVMDNAGNMIEGVESDDSMKAEIG